MSQNASLRRGSAVALFLSMIMLPIMTLLIWSAESLFDVAYHIHATMERVRSYQLLIAEIPDQARAIEGMRSEISHAQAFYEQSTSEAASASMAQTLKETLLQSEGELRSVTIDPASRSADLEKLQVGLDAVIPSATLPRFLASLRSVRPFLFVNSMAINTAQFGTNEGRLWVTMKVSALRRARHDTL